MNTHSRMFQRIGGLGIVYSLLFVGAFILFGNDPSTGASGASVIKYYHSHRVSETAAVFVMAVAAVVLTFFIGSLRRTLSRTNEGRHLASIVTVGGAVYISGLVLTGALNIALIDSAHYGMSTTAQTLNVFSTDAWVPVVVGISILTLGTGVAALRSRASAAVAGVGVGRFSGSWLSPGHSGRSPSSQHLSGHSQRESSCSARPSPRRAGMRCTRPLLL